MLLEAKPFFVVMFADIISFPASLNLIMIIPASSVPIQISSLKTDEIAVILLLVNPFWTFQ